MPAGAGLTISAMFISTGSGFELVLTTAGDFERDETVLCLLELRLSSLLLDTELRPALGGDEIGL